MATKKESTNQKKRKVRELEERDDLFQQWELLSWVSEDMRQTELKKIFLQLFMCMYDDLSEKFSADKRDEFFCDFINNVFPKALDDYKWLESERERHDVGLLNALEQVATCGWYIDLLAAFGKQHNI